MDIGRSVYSRACNCNFSKSNGDILEAKRERRDIALKDRL